MKTLADLKPCPFCKSFRLKIECATPELSDDYAVVCQDCFSQGATGSNKTLAAEFWNTRTEN